MEKVTKEIEVLVTTKEQRKVEVTFPLYRKHDLDDDHGESAIYTRTNADFSEVSIHISTASGRETYEIEFVKRTGMGNASADYITGQGEYKSSEAEFLAALEKAKMALSKV